MNVYPYNQIVLIIHQDKMLMEQAQHINRCSHSQLKVKRGLYRHQFWSRISICD